MKNVIITGATGMIGGMVLDLCLNSNDVRRVTSIVRKPTGRTHEKLVEVLHENFLDFTAIEDHLRHQDICYFCIGVYTGQVPKDEFRRITVDYTKAFATALRRLNEKTTFCFLSGDGADRKEKSRLMFARDKGAAENILFGLHFDQTYTFRPGYIYPVTPRKEPNRAYIVFRYIYKYFARFVFPNIGLTSAQLSKTMFYTGMHGADVQEISNKDIRTIAKKIEQ